MGSVCEIVGFYFKKEFFLSGFLVLTIALNSVFAQTAPTIDVVPDEIIDEDAGLQIVNLSGIGDGDGGGQVISLSATSSNQALIANVDISFNYTSPDATGTLSYTPLTDAFGTTTITITVKDDGPVVNSFQTNFLVTVNPINDPPTFTKGPDVPSTGILLEDPGTQNVFNWATNINAGGTISNEGSQVLTFNLTITGTTSNIAFDLLSINAAGTLTFKPTPNTNGVATIDVVLVDDGPNTPPNNNTSTTETFTITIVSVNDPPVFTGGGNVNVDEGAGTQLFSGWATGITPGGGSDEASQVVSFNLDETNLTGNMSFITDPAIDSLTGDLTFEADPGANGTASYLLTLIDDGPGTTPDQNTSTAITLDIVINPINDPPSFILPDTLQILEDAGAVSIVNFATEVVPGPPDESTQSVSFKMSITQSDGSLTFITPPSINSIGTLTFKTAPDAFGTALIDVILIDDGPSLAPHNNVSDTTLLLLEIIGLNDAPSFVKGVDPVFDEDSGPVVIAGWATKISPGAENESEQALDFQLTSIAKEGNIGFVSAPDITAEGDLVFEAGPDLNGFESFEIRLVDDGLSDSVNFNTSAPQVIKITINAVNDAPTFIVGPDLNIDENQGLTTDEGWATNVTPGGGSDELTQVITFNIEPIQFTGNLVFVIGPLVGPTGDISYQSAPNTWGVADFVIYLSDDGSNEEPNVNFSDNQTFKITVTEVNDPPTDIILSNNTIVDTSPPGTSVGTFTAIDPDDDTHTFTLVDGIGSGDNGDFLIEGDQLITNTEFDFREKNLYTIRVSGSDGLNSVENAFLIEIIGELVTSVTFPSAFTPNNDGENDKWLIEQIEYFPQAAVNIYTKTGQNVYSSTGYTNAWDGTWNGNILPEDTYYVVIDLKNESPVIQGTITILR